MGTHDLSGTPRGGKEDVRKQRERTIQLYESLLGRAREVAQEADERLHRVLDDEQISAQRRSEGY
jgi:ketosteroid isomerase-like protein